MFKDMQIGPTGYSKMPVGANVSVNGSVSDL